MAQRPQRSWSCPVAVLRTSAAMAGLSQQPLSFVKMVFTATLFSLQLIMLRLSLPGGYLTWVPAGITMCNNNPPQVIASRVLSQSPVTGHAVTGGSQGSGTKPHVVDGAGPFWSRLSEESCSQLGAGPAAARGESPCRYSAMLVGRRHWHWWARGSPSQAAVRLSPLAESSEATAIAEALGSSGPWRSAQWPCTDGTLGSSQAPGMKLSVRTSQPLSTRSEG